MANLQTPVRVLLTRNEVSRMTGQPASRIYAAFADGELHPDAVTSTAAPLFALENLSAIKAALERQNSTVIL